MKKSFIDQMERLKGVFGNTHFTQERTFAIYRIVENIPDAWLKNMCDVMIETMKTAPLPNDFRNAVYAQARSNKVYEEQETVYKTDCFDCYDTGFLLCKMNENEPETLVMCHCEQGKVATLLNKSLMPTWENGKFDVVFGFIKLPFPLQNLIPKKDASGELKKLTDEFLKKDSELLGYWKCLMHNSNEYWYMKNRQAKKGEL